MWRSSSTIIVRYLYMFIYLKDLLTLHLVVHQKKGTQGRSKLKLLVPSVGVFFTPILLKKAFLFQDKERRISSRRFVAPSFNDIRLILNSAQIMGIIEEGGPPELVTFDGDVTLYPDGECLTADNPVISRILEMLIRGTKIAIVTAAGYSEAEKYHGRLIGLLNAVSKAVEDGDLKDPVLLVVGGESNYMFSFDISSPHLLRYVSRETWMLDEMKAWTEDKIKDLLDVAEVALLDCIKNLGLSATILRKERAVGIIRSTDPLAGRFTREQLEETVLVTQQVVEISPVGQILPFCAFNGTSRSSILTSLFIPRFYSLYLMWMTDN